MKNFTKWLLILLFVTVYLNIGWHLGTYWHENSHYVVSETGWAHFWAGGWDFLSRPDLPLENRASLTWNQIVYSFIWPLTVVLVVASWIVFAICAVLSWIWAFLGFLFWVVFQGGLGELIVAEETSLVLFFILITSGAFGLFFVDLMSEKVKTAFVLCFFAIAILWVASVIF